MVDDENCLGFVHSVWINVANVGKPKYINVFFTFLLKH